MSRKDNNLNEENTENKNIMIIWKKAIIGKIIIEETEEEIGKAIKQKIIKKKAIKIVEWTRPYYTH